MKSFKREGAFYFVTMALIMVIAFCVTHTVMGQSKMDDPALENYYREKENIMVSGVRDYLEANGFFNSGVSLTRVIDIYGNRSYTLTIHHDRIDAMDSEERNILGDEISAFGFDTNECTFKTEFLIIK